MSLQMEWRTPLEKLKALEDGMNDWLAHEENRWFQPSTSVVLQNIQYQRYLEVTLGISHNGCVIHSFFIPLTRYLSFFGGGQKLARLGTS
jgi:hypothetical protein